MAEMSEGAVREGRDPTGPNVEQAVPFFRVSDLQASLRYYVEGLGFDIVHRWVKDGKLMWCWLRLGGAALMLQEAHPDGGDSRPGAGVTVYFICRDALVIYREVRQRGIQAARPFVGNGMWVTYLSDPDGYRIAFESATDAPEGTAYTGIADEPCGAARSVEGDATAGEAFSR
jgi:lactoylglutathione lyase